MAEGIVQCLEMIEIDEQQGAAGFITGAERDGLRQAIQQQGTVGQMGQGVEESQLLDSFFRYLAFGNVVMGTDIVGDHTVITCHRRDRQPFRIHFAILAAIPYLSLPTTAAMDRFPHFTKKSRIVAARLQHARGLADHLRRGVSGAFGESAVDAQYPALCIGDHHTLARIEGDRRNAQFGLGLFALGDVTSTGAEAGESTLGIADWRPGNR